MVHRSSTRQQNQLIFTGGGSAAASVQPTFFGSSCTAINVVAIHDYTECVPLSLLLAMALGDNLADGNALQRVRQLLAIRNQSGPGRGEEAHH
jgi:hypothetical protein